MSMSLTHFATAASARIAGFWYLLLAIVATIAEFGVRQRLIVPGDAAATAGNLLANSGLFRTGIVLELIGQAVFVLVAFALYDVLKVVNRRQAMLMVALVLLAVGTTAANMVHQAAALMVLEGDAWSAAFDPAQREALATLFLDLHGYGYGVVAQVFFGAWLFPLGALIWASGFLPRVIGVLLGVAGIGYLVDVVIAALAPEVTFVLSEYTFVGEVALLGWLLVKGVNADAWRARRAQALASAG